MTAVSPEELARIGEDVPLLEGIRTTRAIRRLRPDPVPCKLVRKVYVEAGSQIENELYLGIVLDRAAEKLAVIASTEGGVEIEEVAAKTPEKIITVNIEPGSELPAYAVRRVGFGLGLGAE